ncbi:hypothetical protein [Pseudorhodobacter wandonensis]|uniref:hypothetical protein n=1 Tax=Pseudorhodobacter wandonensis TaxID=1120568 RepID=UPI00067DD11B|nr:hypothetical protein [Pseudorhodobacter wandonensis]
MANVEVIATYELYNINRTKLENLIHRILEPAYPRGFLLPRFVNVGRHLMVANVVPRLTSKNFQESGHSPQVQNLKARSRKGDVEATVTARFISALS